MHAQHGRVEIVEALTLYEVHDLRTHAADLPTFLQHHRAIGFLHGAGDRFDIHRPHGAQIDDVDVDSLLRQIICNAHGDQHHLAVGDHRTVVALALELGDTHRNDVLAFRHFTLGVVEHLALEEDNRVIITDCRLEQALGVGGSAWSANLEARDVGEPALPRLRMLRRKLQRRSIGTAEYHRHGELPARHVQHLRGGVHNLIDCEQRKIPRHEFNDRAQANHR